MSHADLIAARLRTLLADLDAVAELPPVRLSPCQRHVLDAIRTNGRPMKAAAVFEFLRRTLGADAYSSPTVCKALTALVHAGRLEKVRGGFALVQIHRPAPPSTDNSTTDLDL